MKLLFVYNKKAGKKFQADIVEQIRAAAGKGHSYIEIQDLKNHSVAEYTTLVAVGGDGTVNHVAQIALENNKVFGIIPKGSGDGLARHLGISKNVSKAVKIILDGRITSIDTALLNAHFFANIAGTGFEAKVAHRFNSLHVRGLIGYMKTIFALFGTSSEKKAVLITDDKRQVVSYFSLSIANGAQWGNNVEIASKADVTDGMLDIAVMKKPKLHQIPLLLSYFTSNKMTSNKLITYYSAKEIAILNAEKLWHIDGEPIDEPGEVHIKIQPRSLKILTHE